MIRLPFEMAGSGIFSISERNLPKTVEYVRRQNAHHAAGTTIARLERVALDDLGPRMAPST